MGMFTRLSNCANRTILYDMYSYVWDIKSIMSMVKSFVQWLGRCTRNNLFSDILSLKEKKTDYPTGEKHLGDLQISKSLNSLPRIFSNM